MGDKKEIIKKLDDLYTKEFQKENFFQFDRKFLFDYMSIQESLPFQNYFKNQFIRLIKPDSLENYLFLEKEKENFNIFDFIRENILREKKTKDIKDDDNSIIKRDMHNQQNLDINAQSFSKDNKKRNKSGSKNDINSYANSKRKIEQNNSKNGGDKKILDRNKEEDLKKRKMNKDNNEEKKFPQIQENLKNKTSEESPKCINSLEKSKKEEKKEKISKNIIDKNNKNIKSNETINSDMGLNLEFIKNKLEKNENDIKEIIKQKENLLEQIIKENKKDKNKRLEFFVDTNKLLGGQFENAGIKYIFELLNCLSLNQDFYFYCNIENNFDDLNTIFGEYNLKFIEKIQIDFVISDLKIIDFIKIFIYLYPNIINLNSFKNEPSKKELIFQKLVNLRNKYKKSKDKIDVFGEIGENIFNQIEKIEQFKKYSQINSYIEKFMNEDEKIADNILEKCKMKKNNKKIVLFLTNGEYANIYNKDFNNEEIFIIFIYYPN